MTGVTTRTMVCVRAGGGPRAGGAVAAHAYRRAERLGRRCALAVLACAVFLGCGTNLPLLSTLTVGTDPGLVNIVTQGAIFPIAPGDANKFVVVKCVNLTRNLLVDFFPSAEIRDVQTLETARVDFDLRNVSFDGGVAGAVLECPLVRITLGSLDQPELVNGFAVGPAAQGKVGIPFTANPLIENVNYSCGDLVLFVAVDDPTAAGGVSIQTGVVSAASLPPPAIDTYGRLRSLLESLNVLINTTADFGGS